MLFGAQEPDTPEERGEASLAAWQLLGVSALEELSR